LKISSTEDSLYALLSIPGLFQSKIYKNKISELVTSLVKFVLIREKSRFFVDYSTDVFSYSENILEDLEMRIFKKTVENFEQTLINNFYEAEYSISPVTFSNLSNPFFDQVYENNVTY
jgi:hypothetical protein